MDALAGARPDAALPVDAEAIEEPRAAFGEDFAALQRLAVGADGEAADVARPVLDMGGAGIDVVEVFLVRRKGGAVRSHHVGDHRLRLPAFRVDAIDVAAVDLLLRPVAFIVAVDAIGGVREPDRVVRFHDHIVRRVEALAFPVVRNDVDRAVDLGAGYAAREVFAGY